jgi:tryptophan halogenase
MNVSSITIVGGGTSGWLTAAYLYKNQPDIKITVVDKEIGTPIGVGEATLLSFKPFMEECGFKIEDWFVPLDAGYKSGILFSNWREKDDDIWHPFYKGNRKLFNGVNTWDSWSCNQNLDFKKYSLSCYDLSIEHNALDANAIDHYGFHVDCGKLVVFLQEYLKDKINIIRSDVMKVNYKDNDTIDSLTLKNEELVCSDLYIDCTGFKNVLRKPAQRIDLSDRLFVNTAIACPVPYQDRESEFKPYAECEAVDHGWIWKIGVASRIGSGMVFNRNITDIDEAKDYFVDHWNNRIKKENIRVIHWDPFYNEDQWAGNVVTIGLSSGFIEPLESTGIGLITYGIGQLNSAIYERRFSDIDRVNFNLQMKILFEDCVDFVSMHYANNNRSSKFWDWVKEKFQPSTRMMHFISELNTPNITVPNARKYNYMFGGSNWSLMLIQLGYTLANRLLPIPDEVAGELLVKSYIEHEKNRHIWSRPHSKEVDRISELTKL